MSKFTDRIKNVFTVDYDDYDDDFDDEPEPRGSRRYGFRA